MVGPRYHRNNTVRRTPKYTMHPIVSIRLSCKMDSENVLIFISTYVANDHKDLKKRRRHSRCRFDHGGQDCPPFAGTFSKRKGMDPVMICGIKPAEALDREGPEDRWKSGRRDIREAKVPNETGMAQT